MKMSSFRYFLDRHARAASFPIRSLNARTDVRHQHEARRACYLR